MSNKIALAFAASCLTAVAAVVPVAASAQDLGSLTDLSSLSVSLFDGPQKQPSPSPSAAPSTSASAAPSTSTTAPSEPAPVVPEPTVPPRQVSEKTDYDAQVGAFRKYLITTITGSSRARVTLHQVGRTPQTWISWSSSIIATPMITLAAPNCSRTSQRISPILRVSPRSLWRWRWQTTTVTGRKTK